MPGTRTSGLLQGNHLFLVVCDNLLWGRKWLDHQYHISDFSLTANWTLKNKFKYKNGIKDIKLEKTKPQNIICIMPTILINPQLLTEVIMVLGRFRSLLFLLYCKGHLFTAIMLYDHRSHQPPICAIWYWNFSPTLLGYKVQKLA